MKKENIMVSHAHLKNNDYSRGMLNKKTIRMVIEKRSEVETVSGGGVRKLHNGAYNKSN